MPINSPISEPVVVKPSSQPNGSNRPPSGPQSKLEQTKYDFKDLRFPPKVGNDAKNIHWIKFIPTVQNKSSYIVKKAFQGGNPEVLSRTDSNRLNTGGQLGSVDEAFTGAEGAAAGAFGALYGGASGAVDAFATLNSPLGGTLGKKVGNIFGAVRSVAGLGAGALAGPIISSINLTRKTRRAAASISLYMPDTINQTVVNDYDSVSMTEALGKAGLFVQAGGDVLNTIKNSPVSIPLGQTLGSAVSGPGGMAIGAAAALGSQASGSAGGAEILGTLGGTSGAFGSEITNALLFSGGYAQNPQVEMLFKSIRNREFLFDFKFSPKDEMEAKEIINIIQTFRFFAAPEIPSVGGGRYFVPPSEFDIQFMVGPNINPNLPKLATCVLEGIDVNYGSAGQWAAFKDGMPVEIAVQIRFKEVEVMHKELVRQGF